MDRVGIMPLNLYESETVLKPVNLNSLICAERVPRKSDELPNSNKNASFPPEAPDNEQVDSFSDSDSEEEVNSDLETTMNNWFVRADWEE